MGIGYETVGNFTTQQFQLTNAQPMVGTVAMGTYAPEAKNQGLYNINATGANLVLPGEPVKVGMSVQTPASADLTTGLNPTLFSINAKATALADVTGFLLQSSNELAQIQGSVPVPVYGRAVDFARIHSGITFWAYVHSSNFADLQTLDNINVGVTLDTTNGGVKKSTGGADLIDGALFASQPVDGVRVVWDNANNLYKLENCKVIAVRLA